MHALYSIFLINKSYMLHASWIFLLGLGLIFLPPTGLAQTVQLETREDVQNAISRYDQLIENTPQSPCLNAASNREPIILKKDL